MNYSFCKEYILLPQSPLIHFQHYQDGATLRATEVKPKLDKYIIKRINQEGKLLPNEWKNKEFPRSLNYKLKIVCEDPKIVELGRHTDYDIFYANMGDKSEKNKTDEDFKKGILSKNKLTVICHITDLIEFIDSIIGDFFVVSNFGTMQDKGFGCYMVEGKSYSASQIAGLLKEEYESQKCYSFKGGNQRQIFKNIKTLHNILKAGNPFSPKVGSLLFKYMDENKNGIKSERDWLKGDASSEEAAYVRSLMGISDHMGPVKRPTTITDLNKEIQRVPSPIWFVVCGETVYFVAKRIPENLYGAEFVFSSEDYNLKSGTLKVPDKETLGESFIDDYLDYACSELQELYGQGKIYFKVSEVN